MLTNIIRTQDLVIKNTFFEKPPKNKATYRKVGMQLGPPWTPDRYEEIDHCIIRNPWKNTIINIQTEPTTNVSTDRFTMIATIRQKLKAIDKKDLDINLKNLDIGPETDSQGNVNPNIIRYNEKVLDILTNEENKDVGTVTEAIKHAAIEIFNIKPSKGKRQDCDPEMAVLIEQRQQAINRNNEEDVKQITKDIKKTAAHKRTKTQLKRSQNEE